jgi:hypothetical protein
MTDLLKPVKRRTASVVRDQGKLRRICITLYPGGVLGLRPERTRREELISLEAAWSQAVKMRLAKERAEKQAAKKRRRQS